MTRSGAGKKKNTSSHVIMLRRGAPKKRTAGPGVAVSKKRSAPKAKAALEEAVFGPRDGGFVLGQSDDRTATKAGSDGSDTGDDAPEAGLRAAWEDDDDTVQRVDLEAHPRRKKLRQSEKDKKVSGRQYSGKSTPRSNLQVSFCAVAVDLRRRVPERNRRSRGALPCFFRMPPGCAGVPALTASPRHADTSPSSQTVFGYSFSGCTAHRFGQTPNQKKRAVARRIEPC